MQYNISSSLIHKAASHVLRQITDGRGGMEIKNPLSAYAVFVSTHDGFSASSPDGLKMHECMRWMNISLWKQSGSIRYTDFLIRLMRQGIFDEKDIESISDIITEALFKNKDFQPTSADVPGFDPLVELPPPEEFSGYEGTLIDDMNDPDDDIMESPFIPSDDPVILRLKCRTPKSIYDYLNRHVYGQDEAKKAASMLLYNHLNGRERNILFIGPTGCGKTEIFRQLRSIYPDIVIADASSLTQNGWKGNNKLSDIFSRLPPDRAGNAIYVFDEADKMLSPVVNSNGTNYSMLMQNEFLKILEGGEISIGGKSISSEHASFVFLGAFEEMIQKKNDDAGGRISIGFEADINQSDKEAVSYTTKFTPEDLVKYAGMRQEIAGRISTIVQLSPLTAGDFRKMMAVPSISPVAKLHEEYQKNIAVPDAVLDKLCREAESSHMGVRYLKARLQDELDRQIFDDPDSQSYVLFCDDKHTKGTGQCIP